MNDMSLFVVFLWFGNIFLFEFAGSSNVSRTFIAKKNDKPGQDTSYASIPTTRLSFCEAFQTCAQDTKCASFSTDAEKKIILLYAMSTRPTGDYVIWNERCPFAEGYIYSRRLGYCIQLNKQQKNWHDARSECQSSGGDLLALETDGKFAEVKSMLDDKSEHYWLGGRRIGSTFLWLSGEEIDGSFWAEGEPNNQNGNQAHVIWLANESFLDDADYNTDFYFICEY